jgi:Holliday junction DNA helicase RuvA
MISFLDGEVVEKSTSRVVLSVLGVGYEVNVPASVLSGLPPVGRSARVYTKLAVRDDSMTLYGFSSPEERQLFEQLTGVTGVGPKVALAFLSALPDETLRRAIAAGEVDTLTVVPGVGKKVAQRVIVDLRERLGGEGEVATEGPLADVRRGLLALGLSQAEAADAMAGVDADGRSTEELLREALQRVGR